MFQRQADRFQTYEPTSPLDFLVFGDRVMVADVLKAMSQAQVSCVFVMEQGQLLGSFTETDVIRVCADGHDLDKLPLAQVMIPSVASLSEAEAADPIKVLEVFERFPVKYLPVISVDQYIRQMITREAAHQQGQPIARLKLKQVREVLTPQVLQVTPDQTLQQVAKSMSYQHQRYSVVVAPDTSAPIGVLTLGDLVQAQMLGYDFHSTMAAVIMSAPPKMVRPDDDLWTAYQTLQRYFLKNLVVVNEQGELAGIANLHQMIQLLNPIDLWQTVVSLQQTNTTTAIALEQSQRQVEASAYEKQRLHNEIMQATRELERLAYLDPLTQLANRRQFDQLLSQEWQRLRRDKQSLAVVLGDIDYFKEYNEHFGYSAGDKCLQQIGFAMAEATQRSPDIVSRYDGEVFALLLPNTDLAGAVMIVERMQQVIRQQQLKHPGSLVAEQITLSFGIATCIPSFGATFADLLTAADRAVYRAKEQGRNTYRVAVENEFTQKPKFKVLEPAELAAL
ncbi:GGDEF domain-containing protein [filamentous cyanobacterium LEGE 11480]|uniref:GGDEF domain-containing protein n=1 Tax=Romeriopsis navalis LEGE 11480 TaxID=2777977 RepID=A0A928VS88_9CYAN|nr:GGDEF domain-containing protein [Romeriopsis navalis]MBE9031244.1 GGDEF domain-containing protein [Romeriopsis navalis LEGE 11480]